MATEHNQLPTPDDSFDIEPNTETADDGGLDHSASEPAPSQPSREGAEPDQGEPQRPQRFRDDKRAQINANSRAARAATMQEFSGDLNDPNIRYGNSADMSDMGDLERQALERQQQRLAQVARPPQQQPQQDAPTHFDATPDLEGLDPEFRAMPLRLKVNGQDKIVSLEQLIRNAQKYDAADEKFEQAQRLVALAKDTIRQVATPAPSGSNRELETRGGNPFDGPDDGNTSQQQSQLDVEALANKIQLGNPQEVIEALGQFVQNMQASQGSQKVDPEQILTAFEDHNAVQELYAFADRNPEVAHPVMQNLMAEQINRIMATDLLNSGRYSREWMIQNIPDAAALARLHKQARISRLPGVRPTSQVLGIALQAAKQTAAQLSGQSAQPPASRQQHQPAPTMQQRQERKASLTQQPATRRAAPASTQQSRTEQQSRYEGFLQLRRARGQSV